MDEKKILLIAGGIGFVVFVLVLAVILLKKKDNYEPPSPVRGDLYAPSKVNDKIEGKINDIIEPATHKTGGLNHVDKKDVKQTGDILNNVPHLVTPDGRVHHILDNGNVAHNIVHIITPHGDVKHMLVPANQKPVHNKDVQHVVMPDGRVEHVIARHDAVTPQVFSPENGKCCNQ